MEKQSYAQYLITESDIEAMIYVYGDQGAALVCTEFADVNSVSAMLHVSRTHAYRVMSTLKRYKVEDHRNGGPRVYTVVRRSDLVGFVRVAAGNPHFSDPAYQKELAKRPRKKKVDN